MPGIHCDTFPTAVVGFSEPVYSLQERELPYALTVTVVQGDSLPQSLSLAVTATPLTACKEVLTRLIFKTVYK